MQGSLTPLLHKTWQYPLKYWCDEGKSHRLSSGKTAGELGSYGHNWPHVNFSPNPPFSDNSCPMNTPKTFLPKGLCTVCSCAWKAFSGYCLAHLLTPCNPLLKSFAQIIPSLEYPVHLFPRPAVSPIAQSPSNMFCNILFLTHCLPNPHTRM